MNPRCVAVLQSIECAILAADCLGDSIEVLDSNGLHTAQERSAREALSEACEAVRKAQQKLHNIGY
jgi:hypothetical protein